MTGGARPGLRAKSEITHVHRKSSTHRNHPGRPGGHRAGGRRAGRCWTRGRGGWPGSSSSDARSCGGSSWAAACRRSSTTSTPSRSGTGTSRAWNSSRPADVPDDLAIGAPSKAGGEASIRYILAAVEAAKRGWIDAIATAPISKEAVRMAGYPWPGHTELLAEKFGAPRRGHAVCGRAVPRGPRHDSRVARGGDPARDDRADRRDLPPGPRGPAAVVRHRGAAAGRLRPEPARRRGRAVRLRGTRDHRAGPVAAGRPRGSPSSAPCPPTPPSTRPPRASSTWSWPCTTTRG